jgi:pimeloyl-ACP methyl ester carboxylesterase
VGTPTPYRPGAAEKAPALIADFERYGVERWARQTMAGRLGSRFPAEGVEFWNRFMGRTALATQLGFMGTIACADIRQDVPRISCPTLVITSAGSGLASVEETRAWQESIPDSELLVVPSDSYHVAASDAEACADATLAFIKRRDPGD